MIITNKKLAKEIKSIFESSDKAKKLALLELDKIDAKYKALAEKEKKSLNDTIKFLDSQLALYGPMLSGTEQTEEEPEQDEPVAEEEEKVIDLFAEQESEETEETEEAEEEPAKEEVSEESEEASPSSDVDVESVFGPSSGSSATTGDDWNEPQEW